MNLDLGRCKDGGRVSASVRLSYERNGSKPEGVAELAIMFEYAPPGGQRPTAWGQLADLEFEPGTLGYIVQFVWKGYHLNTMQAGCEHQRAAGWTYEDHPSEPCPVCGYRMGSRWLRKPLPDDVIALVQSWEQATWKAGEVQS